MAKRSKQTAENLAAALGEYLPVPALRAPQRNSAEDALAFVSGLLFGGVVAGVTAIFLAPTDGATLRSRLKEQFDALRSGVLPGTAELDTAGATGAGVSDAGMTGGTGSAEAGRSTNGRAMPVDDAATVAPAPVGSSSGTI